MQLLEKMASLLYDTGALFMKFRHIVSSSINHNKIKITVNTYGMITLESTVKGKRHRLSTGEKVSWTRLLWYRVFAEKEFVSLYEQRYKGTQGLSETFKNYGHRIIVSTASERNAFTQKSLLAKFEILCETFGGIDICDIRASDVMLWQNAINKSPKTLINYRSVLNIIFKFALYDGIIKVNPLTVVKAPKNPPHDVETFTAEQLDKLLDNCDERLSQTMQ